LLPLAFTCFHLLPLAATCFHLLVLIQSIHVSFCLTFSVGFHDL
jgi:hypothetical protein